MMMSLRLIERLGQPDDDVSAVLYPASDEASIVRGVGLLLAGRHPVR